MKRTDAYQSPLAILCMSNKPFEHLAGAQLNLWIFNTWGQGSALLSSPKCITCLNITILISPLQMLSVSVGNFVHV